MYEPPTLKEIFTFNRRERSGILICLFLIITAHYSYSYYKNQLADEKLISYNPPDEDEISPSTYESNTSPTYKANTYTTPTTKTTAPLSINLNLATQDELIELPHIGPVLSKRIVKFRDAKGGFDNINELKKIYGLSPEAYESIMHMVYVPEKSNRAIRNTEEKEEKKQLDIVVDINTANAATFSLLPRISPKMGTAIVNYRNTIGGFDSLSQLKQVYVISPKNYDIILPHLRITAKTSEEKEEVIASSIPTHLPAQPKSMDTSLDIDINTATAAELQSIKGIGPAYSNRIITLRDKLSGYHSLSQLNNVYGMNDTLYQSITKHLSIKTPHQAFIIDTISFKNLLGKKILTYEEVKYIFNLKSAKNRPLNKEDIMSLQGIDPAHIHELLPYLKFSN